MALTRVMPVPTKEMLLIYKKFDCEYVVGGMGRLLVAWAREAGDHKNSNEFVIRVVLNAQ